MPHSPEATLYTTLEQLELMTEAAAQTLRLLQHQLAAAKQLLADAPASIVGPVPRTIAPAPARDFTEWLLNGVPYPKGKFVLAVFKEYAAPRYTLAELQELFAADKVYSKKTRGNKVVFKRAADVSGNEAARFHPDPVRTRDGELIRVTNQIGMNNFPELLPYLAELFGFPIQTKE